MAIGTKRVEWYEPTVEEVADGVLAAVRGAADTAVLVAKQLRWTRHDRGLDELDLFNQSLAVSETAAHLVLLEAHGRVRRVVEDGVDHYSAN